MFDANMRCLPKDTEFFAEVYCTGPEDPLYFYGVKSRDIILCTMLDDCDQQPNILVHLKDKDVKINYMDNFCDKWYVYSGKKDLTGFLPQEEDIRQKAIKLLKERGEIGE